jgi:hypothetical protein
MSRRGKFWLAFTMLVVLLLLGLSTFLLALRIAFQSFTPPSQTVAPSPAGLGLLALVVAVSLYLRQVASAADEKYDKILRNESPIYPQGKKYTDKKLNALNSTHENMHVVAPFLIALSVFVILRFSVDAISGVGFIWPQQHPLILKVADFLILEWFVLAMLGLAFLHWKARRRDEAIRDEAVADRHPA